MLRLEIAKIIEYEESVKVSLYNKLRRYTSSARGYDVCIVIHSDTIMKNPKISLDIREYSDAYQLNLISEYIMSHDLNHILVFLETIAIYGVIEFRKGILKATDRVISIAKELLK